MVNQTGPKPATWVIGYAEMMGMGMISGAYGPMLAEQVPYFKLTLSQAGLPVALEGVGYLLGTLVVPLMWRLNRARGILLGSYAAVVLLLASVFFHHRDFAVYLIQVFLLGVASGVIIVAVDSFLSDTHRPFQAPYLNLSHLFYGLGAFFGPIVVAGVLLWIGSWHYFFLVLTLVFVTFLPFMWGELLRQVQGADQAAALPPDHGASENPFGSLSFWLINLGMFFALGTEFGLATWQPIFLIRVRGLSPAQANICVSSFWLALMAGRFIYIRFLAAANVLKTVMAATILCAGSLFLAIFSSRTGFIMLFTAGAGLGISILYPNLLAMATTKYFGRTGLITGVLSFCSGLGTIFMPWVLGPMSQAWGLADSMYFLPFCGLATALLVAWIWLKETRPGILGPAHE